MYIPSYVEDIIKRLETNNYEAYIVGGAVRDFLLGKEPKDYDIATNCLPDQVQNLFKDKKIILIGKEYGTINIVNEGRNIEVTTYRSDGQYLDGRKPSYVSFSSDLEEDLKRRDFTINALAYNSNTGIVDIFSGMEDLKNKSIKTVGQPYKRFSEDYLRILRGVRFASQLEFTISDQTFQAMIDLRHKLSEVSSERIRNEFFKVLLSNKPSIGINLLKDTGILEKIFPDIYTMVGFEQFNPNHKHDVYMHSLCVLDKTDSILPLRIAALFHDIGKPKTFSIDEDGIGHFYGHADQSRLITSKILKKLNSPKKLMQDVDLLIRYHMNSKDDIKEKGLKRLVRKVGEENIYNLLKLQVADISCSSCTQEDIRRLERRKQDIDNIILGKKIYKKDQLDISGKDLIDLGFEEGRIIGEILDYLYDKVLEDEDLNQKDKLIGITREKYHINKS